MSWGVYITVADEGSLTPLLSADSEDRTKSIEDVCSICELAVLNTFLHFRRIDALEWTFKTIWRTKLAITMTICCIRILFFASLVYFITNLYQFTVMTRINTQVVPGVLSWDRKPVVPYFRVS